MHVNRSMFCAAFAAAGLLGALGCQSTMTESVARDERPETTRAPQQVASDPAPAAPVARPEAVYFDLDRWDLDEGARRTLKSSAAQIQAHPEWGVVTIEGHCDARGSDEYNIALGSRRAAAVKRYLVDLGVPPSRFETVTYGEDRPSVRGEGEQVWSLNRRSEIRVGLHQASR